MSNGVNIAFPYEGLAIKIIDLIILIWDDLSDEQKQQVAGWSIADIEKARKFWKADL